MTTIAEEVEKTTKVKRKFKNQRYHVSLAIMDNFDLRIIATVNKKARTKPKIILL